jgi:hypothetical protein
MKRVTKKKIQQAKPVEYLNGGGLKSWKFENTPKEIIPTEKDVGALVIVADDPSKRKKDPHYRIRKLDIDKNGKTIVELISTDYGFASKSIECVILNNKKDTKEEELKKEFEKKKNDGTGKEDKQNEHQVSQGKESDNTED